MGIYGAFTHCGLFINGVDLTGDSNMVKLTAGKEVRERSVFGNTGKVRTMGGLEDIQLAAAGFHNNAAAGQDVAFRANLGSNDICASLIIPSVAKTPPAAGDNGWFFKATQGQYATGEAQGNDLLWNLSLQGGAGGYPLVFGKALNPGVAPITEDGNGPAVLVGSALAGQNVYALLHVLEVSAGDSIAVSIQSDDNAGFASATTRFTFTAKGAIGAEYLARLAGPIADTYWRAVYDVTGTGVSIRCAVLMGIQ